MTAAGLSDHRDDGTIAFGERILGLLDQGRFTATYKYAVLLALIDLSLEQTDSDGRPPVRITTKALALKVIELYWPQTAEFASYVQDVAPEVLRQNQAGQARIVAEIVKFRASLGGRRPLTALQARARDVPRFDRLIAEVEWKLAEMPLPRLQQVGLTRTPFIYEIDWDESIQRRDFFATGSRAVDFVDRASEHLVRLAGLLRPLVQRQWAGWIASNTKNRTLVRDSFLEDFLFGAQRVSLHRVQSALADVQNGECFYCSKKIAGVHVDHFEPWSRHFDNGLDNLVAACARCNSSKSNLLASGRHVERWARRFDADSQTAGNLAHIANELGWEQQPARTLNVARATYLRLPGTLRLWRDPTTAVALAVDRAAIRTALARRVDFRWHNSLAVDLGDSRIAAKPAVVDASADSK